MKKESTGHPILFSIMLGILLTSLVTIASAFSFILEFSNTGIMIAQTGAFLVMAILLTIYMTSKGKSLKMFGFRKIEVGETKKVLYYIPLLIIALVQPILGGMNMKLSFVEVFTIIIFTLTIGYTEETLFRGVLKEKLQFKGATFYIIFSSVFFGILHMANAFRGSNLTVTILQVINAFLVGLILAQLITVIDNIIPLIAFHFMYDALATMTNIDANGRGTLILVVLDLLYIAYAGYLYLQLKKIGKYKEEIVG